MCKPFTLDIQRWVLADGLRDSNLTRRWLAERSLDAIPSAARALYSPIIF